VSVNGRLAEVDLVDVVEDDLGLEALGVLQEALHQLGALHAVDVGRPVVHLGGRHQLAALRDAGDQQRMQVGPGRVDGGGVAGGAGTEDQYFGVLVVMVKNLCGKRDRSVYISGRFEKYQARACRMLASSQSRRL
jgi:hypothetical protein